MNRFNYEELLTFPFKGEEARRYFIVGAAIALAGFIIPVLPHILLIGYAAQTARLIIRDEASRMIAWEDWEKLFMDGLKLIAVRFVFALPALIIVAPFFIALIYLASTNTDLPGAIGTIFPLVYMAVMILAIVVIIAITFILPAAEMRFIDTGEFSAAFRFNEWLPIFRANIGGFVVALIVSYLVGMAASIVIQILAITLILACLLIVLAPAVTFYLTLVPYVFAAQAYRDGKAKLAQHEEVIFAP